MSRSEPVGPGQHATSPSYVRKRKNAEAVMARAEKQEQRLARKHAPKPVKAETAAQRLDKKVRSIMSAFMSRRTEDKKPWTEGQLRHHETLVRRGIKRREEPDYRKATRAPYRRWKRKVRARIAARSHARNRTS